MLESKVEHINFFPLKACLIFTSLFLASCASIYYTENGFSETSNYRIVSLQSGKTLSVVGGNAVESASINQSRYKKLNSQQWQISEVSPATYKIISKNTDLALSYNGRHESGSGYAISLLPYRGVSGQHWQIEYLGNNRYRILSVKANESLDVRGGVKTDGAEIMLWTYHGAANQKWLLKEVE
jgi:hypothetical protein